MSAYKRSGGPQEPFFVRIKDGNERDFREVQAFPEQVDPDQHVEDAAPEIPQDLDPFERFDVRVQVSHLHAQFLVVGRQILRHPLGERRHEHALFPLGTVANLLQQVIHLPAHRPHLDGRIHESGRTNHLLDHDAAGLRELVWTGRGGDMDDLVHTLFPLREVQRPVIERRWQAESVGNEHFLP